MADASDGRLGAQEVGGGHHARARRAVPPKQVPPAPRRLAHCSAAVRGQAGHLHGLRCGCATASGGGGHGGRSTCSHVRGVGAAATALGSLGGHVIPPAAQVEEVEAAAGAWRGHVLQRQGVRGLGAGAGHCLLLRAVLRLLLLHAATAKEVVRDGGSKQGAES